MRLGKRVVHNAAKETRAVHRSLLLAASVAAALLFGACADAAAESGGGSSDGELVTVNAGNDLAALRSAAENAVHATASPADRNADDATVNFLSSRHATLQAASDAAAALATERAVAERAAAESTAADLALAARSAATEAVAEVEQTPAVAEQALAPVKTTDAVTQRDAAERAERETAEQAAREAAENAAREQAERDAAAAARDKAAIEAASKPAADKAAADEAARKAAANKAAADEAARKAAADEAARKAAANKAAADEAARKAAADKAAQDEANRQAAAQQAAAAATAVSGPHAELEAQFLQMINAKRAQIGVAPLVASAGLQAPARTHAANMANRNVLEHQNLSAVLTATSFHTVGENVGYGPSVQVVHDALVASPGHYANLSNPAFTHIGVAVYFDPSGKLWTAHVFGG